MAYFVDVVKASVASPLVQVRARHTVADLVEYPRHGTVRATEANLCADSCVLRTPRRSGCMPFKLTYRVWLTASRARAQIVVGNRAVSTAGSNRQAKERKRRRGGARTGCSVTLGPRLDPVTSPSIGSADSFGADSRCTASEIDHCK